MVGFVCILPSQRNGTIYTGVTANLLRCVQQHREKPEGSVAQYQVRQLVWYEEHESIEATIRREKAIKKGKRVWKLDLIEGFDPDWRDLWHEIASESSSLPPHTGDGRASPGHPDSLLELQRMCWIAGSSPAMTRGVLVKIKKGSGL